MAYLLSNISVLVYGYFGTTFQKNIPGETWTHPPTSIVISDFWNLLFFTNPLTPVATVDSLRPDAGDWRKCDKHGYPSLYLPHHPRLCFTPTHISSSTCQHWMTADHNSVSNKMLTCCTRAAMVPGFAVAFPLSCALAIAGSVILACSRLFTHV